MRTIAILVLLAAFSALALAAAQTKTVDSSQDVGKAPNQTTCAQAAVKELRQAVDPLADASLQEWHLRAAQAYRELADLGESC